MENIVQPFTNDRHENASLKDLLTEELEHPMTFLAQEQDYAEFTAPDISEALQERRLFGTMFGALDYRLLERCGIFERNPDYTPTDFLNEEMTRAFTHLYELRTENHEVWLIIMDKEKVSSHILTLTGEETNLVCRIYEEELAKNSIATM